MDIVVDGHDPPLAESLRRLGWPVTAFPGEDPAGASPVRTGECLLEVGCFEITGHQIR